MIIQILVCFLCLPSTGSIFLEEVLPNVGCPRFFHLFKNMCYLLSNDDYNYVDAEIECHLQGGHLVADDNSELHQFLSTIANNNPRGDQRYWLGATDFIREGHWRWLANGDDVGASGFSSWERGQPDGTGPYINCMGGYVDGGSMVWRDYDCKRNHFPFICEKPKLADGNGNSTVSSGIPSGGCEAGWAEFREDCIFISNIKLTFLESEVDCRNKGGYLASDDSVEKQEFLSKVVNLMKGSQDDGYWIGGTHFVNLDEWRWAETGQPINGYTHWGIGQPQSSVGANCIALQNSSSGLVWVNKQCDQIDNYYICEKTNPSFSTSTTQMTTPALGAIIG